MQLILLNLLMMPKNMGTDRFFLSSKTHFPIIRFSIEKKGFNWQKLKNSRDNYVRSLSGIYKSFLPDIGVTQFLHIFQ